MNDERDRTAGRARAATNDSASGDEARPDALAGLPDDRMVDADVREDLRAGREPFGRIMAARRSLPTGGVLRVRAIFEPVPLYRVMANHGLEHWTERLGPDDWRVWFFEPELVGSASGPASDPSGADPGAARGSAGEDRPDRGEDRGGEEATPAGAADEVVLDVRGLEPPEPMVRTLEALEDLPTGATLLQVNARVPRFLLPRLEERGFTWEIDEQPDDEVRVRIRRAGAGERTVDRTIR